MTKYTVNHLKTVDFQELSQDSVGMLLLLFQWLMHNISAFVH